MFRGLDDFCRAVSGDYDPVLVCCLLAMLAGTLAVFVAALIGAASPPPLTTF